LRKREKKNVSLREREKEKPLQDTSLPHLLSLFSTLPITAMMVGRNVITQAPSGSSNTTTTSNTRSNTNKRNSKPKEICRFQH
jgi:hypothetical protein